LLVRPAPRDCDQPGLCGIASRIVAEDPAPRGAALRDDSGHLDWRHGSFAADQYAGLTTQSLSSSAVRSWPGRTVDLPGLGYVGFGAVLGLSLALRRAMRRGRQVA